MRTQDRIAHDRGDDDCGRFLCVKRRSCSRSTGPALQRDKPEKTLRTNRAGTVNEDQETLIITFCNGNPMSPRM